MPLLDYLAAKNEITYQVLENCGLANRVGVPARPEGHAVDVSNGAKVKWERIQDVLHFQAETIRQLENTRDAAREQGASQEAERATLDITNIRSKLSKKDQDIYDDGKESAYFQDIYDVFLASALRPLPLLAPTEIDRIQRIFDKVSGSSHDSSIDEQEMKSALKAVSVLAADIADKVARQARLVRSRLHLLHE